METFFEVLEGTEGPPGSLTVFMFASIYTLYIIYIFIMCVLLLKETLVETH